MSLRDALLKAGKVSAKAAQEAKTNERKKRKKKKGHVLEAEREAARTELFEQQRAEQAEANRVRAEADRLAREAHERQMRIGNLIRAWERKAPPRAMRGFCYVRASGHIGQTTVDRKLGMELEYGSVGIVEHPSTGAPHMLSREGIERLLEVAPDCVRFYTGPGGPEDPLIRPPLRPELQGRAR